MRLALCRSRLGGARGRAVGSVGARSIEGLQSNLSRVASATLALDRDVLLAGLARASSEDCNREPSGGEEAPLRAARRRMLQPRGQGMAPPTRRSAPAWELWKRGQRGAGAPFPAAATSDSWLERSAPARRGDGDADGARRSGPDRAGPAHRRASGATSRTGQFWRGLHCSDAQCEDPPTARATGRRQRMPRTGATTRPAASPCACETATTRWSTRWSSCATSTRGRSGARAPTTQGRAELFAGVFAAEQQRRATRERGRGAARASR